MNITGIKKEEYHPFFRIGDLLKKLKRLVDFSNCWIWPVAERPSCISIYSSTHFGSKPSQGWF